MPDALKPSTSLLCKLGSIAVHAEEMTSLTGHAYDKQAMDSLLQDAEVREWIKAMNKLAMLPRKRTMEVVRLAAKKQRGK